MTGLFDGLEYVIGIVFIGTIFFPILLVIVLNIFLWNPSIKKRIWKNISGSILFLIIFFLFQKNVNQSKMVLYINEVEAFISIILLIIIVFEFFKNAKLKNK